MEEERLQELTKRFFKEVGFREVKQFPGEYVLMEKPDNLLLKLRIYDNGNVWVGANGRYEFYLLNAQGG